MHLISRVATGIPISRGPKRRGNNNNPLLEDTLAVEKMVHPVARQATESTGETGEGDYGGGNPEWDQGIMNAEMPLEWE